MTGVKKRTKLNYSCSNKWYTLRYGRGRCGERRILHFRLLDELDRDFKNRWGLTPEVLAAAKRVAPKPICVVRVEPKRIERARINMGYYAKVRNYYEFARCYKTICRYKNETFVEDICKHLFEAKVIKLKKDLNDNVAKGYNRKEE